MNRNIDRFTTNIEDFEGEGLDIEVKGNRMDKPYLEVGTIVELTTINEKAEIDFILPIYEKKMYDYRAIINVDGVDKHIYFDGNIIKGYEELLEKKNNIKGSKVK